MEDSPSIQMRGDAQVGWRPRSQSATGLEIYTLPAQSRAGVTAVGSFSDASGLDFGELTPPVHVSPRRGVSLIAGGFQGSNSLVLGEGQSLQVKRWCGSARSMVDGRSSNQPAHQASHRQAGLRTENNLGTGASRSVSAGPWSWPAQGGPGPGLANCPALTGTGGGGGSADARLLLQHLQVEGLQGPGLALTRTLSRAEPGGRFPRSCPVQCRRSAIRPLAEHLLRWCFHSRQREPILDPAGCSRSNRRSSLMLGRMALPPQHQLGVSVHCRAWSPFLMSTTAGGW